MPLGNKCYTGEGICYLAILSSIQARWIWANLFYCLLNSGRLINLFLTRFRANSFDLA